MVALFHSKKKGTSKNEMHGIYDEKWFVGRMRSTFHISVAKENVSYEAYGFSHEEIDDSFISVEHLKHLPNPLLLQSYMYIDPRENEWISGIVIDEETRNLLYG